MDIENVEINSRNHSTASKKDLSHYIKQYQNSGKTHSELLYFNSKKDAVMKLRAKRNATLIAKLQEGKLFSAK